KFSFLMKLIANLSTIDRQATEAFGIPGLTLMEQAGWQVAQAVLQRLETLPGGPPWKIALVCGPGNNGGGGFVAARLLGAGERLQLTVLHTSARYQGDAGVNFARLQAESTTRLTLLDLSGGSSSLPTEAGQALQAA